MKLDLKDVYAVNAMDHYLTGNPYPGRGIVCGYSPDGKKAVTAYFIMGRSENSRNRVFTESGADVKILPYDESKVGDPSLIIYYPLRMTEGHMIVTNGDQTDTIKEFIESGKAFRDALATREFELDAPNYTPRISAVFYLSEGRYEMSILKSEDKKGSSCSRFYYEYTAIPGQGTFIHTYETDGSPLPSFTGEPERVSIPSDIDEFTENIWDSLDKDNKISLYVRYLDIATSEHEDRLINKYSLDQ